MTRNTFYATCPRTRVEFISKFHGDYKFRNEAKVRGFNVVGDSVIFPSGKVANATVR